MSKIIIKNTNSTINEIISNIKSTSIILFSLTTIKKESLQSLVYSLLILLTVVFLNIPAKKLFAKYQKNLYKIFQHLLLYIYIITYYELNDVFILFVMIPSIILIAKIEYNVKNYIKSAIYITPNKNKFVFWFTLINAIAFNTVCILLCSFNYLYIIYLTINNFLWIYTFYFFVSFGLGLIEWLSFYSLNNNIYLVKKTIIYSSLTIFAIDSSFPFLFSENLNVDNTYVVPIFKNLEVKTNIIINRIIIIILFVLFAFVNWLIKKLIVIG